MTYPAPLLPHLLVGWQKVADRYNMPIYVFQRGTHTTRSRMRPKAWGAWSTPWPPRCWFQSKSLSTKLASSSLDRRVGIGLLLVVETMSSGIRAQETEPTADRARESRKPGDITPCSLEEIVSHAAAAGRALMRRSSAPVEQRLSPSAPTTGHICGPSRPAGSRFWLTRHRRGWHPKKHLRQPGSRLVAGR